MFTSLGGTSAANVYVAGWRRPSGALGEEREGVVLHFDGKTWTEVAGGGNQIVTGLWAQAPDEVYFIGPALNGLEQIRRFDGQVFQEVDSEGRLAPKAIWGAPTGELFVAGTNGFVLTKR
jgi:hypothetical protein